MHRAWSWRFSSTVGVLSIAFAASHCGGASSSGLGTNADAGTDGDLAGPRFGLSDGSACRAAGAGCSFDADCCTVSCVANVCGGARASDGAAPPVNGTAPVSGTPSTSCGASGAGCTRGFECCSGTCNGGACVGSTPGAAAGGPTGGAAICLAPRAACAQSPQCCSGLCEPVTGQAAVVQCRDACRANAVACATAQDCCSLGCFGGVCAAQLCAIVGDHCAANADCCSGVCNAQQCEVDLANSRCRPTGEDCSKGPQSGCCGATDKNDLCGPDGRCILPPGACRGQKASCTSDADCCSKHCDSATKTCLTLCIPTSGTCTSGADCCSSSCTSGHCDAPTPTPPPPTPGGGVDAGPAGDGGSAPGPACAAIGSTCTTGTACCSGLCLAGFCDRPLL